MIKLTRTNIAFIVAVIFLIAVIGWLMVRKSKDNDDQPPTPPQGPLGAPPGAGAPKPQSSGQKTLILFHADWCGPCQNFKPTWGKIKEALNGSPIQCQEMESKDPDMMKYKIKGFPTIRVYPTGIENVDSGIDYQGDRSMDSVMQFVQNS